MASLRHAEPAVEGYSLYGRAIQIDVRTFRQSDISLANCLFCI